MIGYLDSGKDAGKLSTAWALYKDQEELIKVAKQYGIKLTMFHGWGGTIGREGGPTHLAILSQPPDTIHSSLRVTIPRKRRLFWFVNSSHLMKKWRKLCWKWWNSVWV